MIILKEQDQILFQNLTNTLMDFPKGKLVAVNLKSWQAIEFFTSLGFNCRYSPLLSDLTSIPAKRIRVNLITL